MSFTETLNWCGHPFAHGYASLGFKMYFLVHFFRKIIYPFTFQKDNGHCIIIIIHFIHCKNGPNSSYIQKAIFYFSVQIEFYCYFDMLYIQYEVIEL